MRPRLIKEQIQNKSGISGGEGNAGIARESGQGGDASFLAGTTLHWWFHDGNYYQEMIIPKLERP